LNQFSVEPSKVIEQLQVVQSHNKLFKQSSVFRQIHEKVTEEDDNLANESTSDSSDEEEDNSMTQEWNHLFARAEQMFYRYNKFILRLSEHRISIFEVQEYFEEILEKKHLNEELKHLEETSNLKGWVNGVELSINRLFTIKQYSEAANAVKKAAEVLGRESTFEVVESILQATQGDAGFKNQPLSIISEELIRAGETFSAWTETQIKTLTCLSISGKILKWLKENIKDRGDLKTFYELATISAGESDIEVDKVSNFYQSVNGYAPLILDLNIEGCTFSEFLMACNGVFNALERDDNIAAKLVDSNRNLEWIKACKDQQGSVEQTSLTMVAKINLSGVYNITMPDRKSATSTNVKTIHNCIKLKYQKVTNQTDGEILTTELTLEDLQELRSKLMLITLEA